MQKKSKKKKKNQILENFWECPLFEITEYAFSQGI